MIEQIVNNEAVPAPITKNLKATLIPVLHALRLRRSSWKQQPSDGDLDWLYDRLQQADVATGLLVDKHKIVTNETASRLVGSLARLQSCVTHMHKNTSGVSVPMEQCVSALLRDAHALLTESGFAELADCNLADSLPEIQILREFSTDEGHDAVLIAVVPQNTEETSDFSFHDAEFLDAATHIAAKTPLDDLTDRCAALFSDHETGIAAVTQEVLSTFGAEVCERQRVHLPMTHSHAFLQSMFGDRLTD